MLFFTAIYPQKGSKHVCGQNWTCAGEPNRNGQIVGLECCPCHPARSWPADGTNHTTPSGPEGALHAPENTLSRTCPPKSWSPATQTTFWEQQLLLCDDFQLYTARGHPGSRGEGFFLSPWRPLAHTLIGLKSSLLSAPQKQQSLVAKHAPARSGPHTGLVD